MRHVNEVSPRTSLDFIFHFCFFMKRQIRSITDHFKEQITFNFLFSNYNNGNRVLSNADNFLDIHFWISLFFLSKITIEQSLN